MNGLTAARLAVRNLDASKGRYHACSAVRRPHVPHTFDVIAASGRPDSETLTR